MVKASSALSVDWLATCREAAQGMREVLAAHPTTDERAQETGRGEGGDLALVIDRAVEDAVFAGLDALHAAGHRFTAISEERGEVSFGSREVLVVIDPIDGSLNAKRDIPHHSLSIAVADGSTMADVAFGFVHDFGTGEEWVATRGEGATLDSRPLDKSPRERRDGAGRLEVVGIESADPRWVAEAAPSLAAMAHRLRAFGSIAVTLCQVAGARFDAMASLRSCRAVDAAAGQLIVREAGGLVAFPRFDDPLGAPLDLIAHSPVVAARTPAGLEQAATLPL